MGTELEAEAAPAVMDIESDEDASSYPSEYVYNPSSSFMLMIICQQEIAWALHPRLFTSQLADQQNLIKIDVFWYLTIQIKLFQIYRQMRTRFGQLFHILRNCNFIIRSARKIEMDLRLQIDLDPADPFQFS